jgi:hypothetical protein
MPRAQNARASSSITRRKNVRKRYTVLAASLCAALIASPPLLSADAAGSMYMNTSEIKWGDAPPSLPKGAKIAVLSGDPGKPGPFVARLQVPASYKIAPHYHSTDEDLTVISGSFHLGEGDKMEMKGGHEIKAGGFHHLPAKTHHYAYSKGPTVIQINAMGPFDIVYIDPKDDPSKMADAKAAPAKDAMSKDGMSKDAMKKDAMKK